MDHVFQSGPIPKLLDSAPKGALDLGGLPAQGFGPA